LKEDEYIKIYNFTDIDNYLIEFKASYLKRLNFTLDISLEKIRIFSNNTKILVTQNQHDLWLEPNKKEVKFFNQGVVSNEIKIAVPNAEGLFFPEWKKKIVSSDEDQDISMILKIYPKEPSEFAFDLFIGQFVKKYRLKFGNYAFNSLVNI
jgi:hypothetical protein